MIHRDLSRWAIAIIAISPLVFAATLQARIYSVGPSQELEGTSAVPWGSHASSDSVLIHWRPEPDHERWVICFRTTKDKPVVVSGVLGPEDQRPVIDDRTDMGAY